MNKWEDYAQDCPWKTGLKCTVLHIAGRYATLGGDGCRENHCAPYHFIKRKAEATTRYGCHCDLEPGMAPDRCVIDEGMRNDCVNAMKIERKEQCQYWRVVEVGDE